MTGRREWERRVSNGMVRGAEPWASPEERCRNLRVTRAGTHWPYSDLLSTVTLGAPLSPQSLYCCGRG